MDTNYSKFDETIGLIYGGFVILGGAIAGILAFTANRFTLFESIFLIAGGVACGIGLALICHAILTLLKK